MQHSQPKVETMKQLLTLVFLGFTVNNTFAQGSESPAVPQEQEINVFAEGERWGVGLQAGLLSGYGVGVRFHPQGRWGGQIAGVAFKASDNLISSIGAEVQFDLDVMNWARFYTYAAAGYYSNGKDDKPLKAPFRAGLGIAYEWVLSGKLIINVSLAFTYFNVHNADDDILPLPQAGFYYYFQ